jgi:NitT/TauT family transport system substrate-binding protein
MTSGGIFATEATIAEKPELVQAMVDATMRGWQAALAEPEAAAETVVRYNGELSVPSQVAQIKAMGELICFGPTLEGRFGYSDFKSWETSQKVLLGAKLIDAPIELDQGFTNASWEKAPAEYRKVSCPAS